MAMLEGTRLPGVHAAPAAPPSRELVATFAAATPEMLVSAQLVTALGTLHDCAPDEVVDALTGTLWGEETAGRIKELLPARTPA